MYSGRYQMGDLFNLDVKDYWERLIKEMMRLT